MKIAGKLQQNNRNGGYCAGFRAQLADVEVFSLINSSLCSVACWSQKDGSLLIHMQLGNVNKTGAAGNYQSLYLSYLRRLRSSLCAHSARSHSHLSAG